MRSRWDILKHYTLKIGIYLCAFLFVYAAVSKLLDFEAFETQLGQSPLLSAYAKPVAIGVPLLELLISIFLMVPRFRFWGLYAFYGLMVMFTTYIVIILNFSDFVPCSCGGVLEAMGWTEHLIFNTVFVLFSAFSVWLISSKKHKILLTLSLLTIFSVGVVTIVFFSSEKQIKYNNAFVRRFAPHSLSYLDEYDLKLNSYYVIDIYQDSIYLGNVTAPLFIGIIPLKMDTLIKKSVALDSQAVKYRTSKIDFYPPYFFMMDGVMPYVYRGKIGEWKAVNQQVKAYFSLAVPIDSISLFVRSRFAINNESIIGKIEFLNDLKIELNDNLLEKQIDGVFDTDGTLMYNKELDRLIYTYFYRNQFLVIRPNLELDFKGNTIDTISKAQIKVGEYNGDGKRKMIQPPLTTNKNMATYGQWLLVHSGLRGKNEPSDIWNRSSILDVYDLEKRIYSFSIYVPHRNRDKMSQFIISKGYLVAVFDQHIRLYQLNPKWFVHDNKTIDQ